MKIKAAVLKAYNHPFSIEEVTLDEPAADEVLVQLVAAGICHTDIAVQENVFPFPVPAILGHEGAGIVVATGAHVKTLVPGDHVILSFLNCGACDSCVNGHPAYCNNLLSLNLSGKRQDGSSPYHMNGSDINGFFFHQSSFATYTITGERNAVKIDKDVPLEILAPLGCSIQTGVGTVLNVIRPGKDTSLLICGVGPVGLAAVIAAQLSSCRKIIALDKRPERLRMASVLGATHVCNVDDRDPDEFLRAYCPEGVHHVIDTTGSNELIGKSLLSLLPRGTCVLLGVKATDSQLTVPYFPVAMGRTIRGVLEGDCDPHEIIPRLVAWYKAGLLPIDRMITKYKLNDINHAITDIRDGRTIKAVIRM